MKYYIYHIPGIKIGCSKNPESRVKAQGYTQFEILEEHSNIQEASKREIDLQLQYAYGRDNNKPYFITINMPTFESRSKGGKISGRKNIESGHLSRIRSISASKNGKLSANKIKICPYCNKELTGNAFNRWHGDRCKLKGQSQIDHQIHHQGLPETPGHPQV